MSFRDDFERGQKYRAERDWYNRGLAGRRRYGVAESRARPLHWTRMLWIAAAIGAVIAAIGSLAVSEIGGVETPFRVMFWMLIGALAGVIVVSILERAGVFERTDE